MTKLIKTFKRIIILSLLFFMAILITIATYELIVFLVSEIVGPITESGVVLGTNGLVAIFGFFFNVLIGFELFETIELYLEDGTFHGEIMLMIGIVAVSRKIIVLDFARHDPLLIIALGILIGFLTFGYYLIKRSSNPKQKTEENL